MSLGNGGNKPTMDPPDSGVKVRMYNPGFGDCMLLAFKAKENEARYMLIDFGVHHLYPEREEKTKAIAEDIKKATGNKLDVVAITHEHTDHLYGFKYNEEIFKNVDIEDLWLAWTENPRDSVAKKLKKKYGRKIRALESAAHQLKATNKPFANALQGVLEFEALDDLKAAKNGKKTQLDYLRNKSKKKLKKKSDYRQPKETPLHIPDVKGVKIYVLGPPRDVDWIKKLQKKSELYPKFADLDELDAFAYAALAAARSETPTDEEKQYFNLGRPFQKHFEISKVMAPEDSEYSKFFQKHYGFSDKDSDDLKYRRIETDWLSAAEALALDISSKTNNTSLVLAIELTETHPRKVLLFVGDAQVGNWLSWHDLEWPGEGQNGETVTTEDLLRRTVLYKVGHHGSHNATLSHKGLEMMDSPDLVAMIPVDEKWANNKMRWEHPAEKLLNRLTERTKGRIIRTDEIPEGNNIPEIPDESADSEWEAFIDQLDWDRKEKLWIQYTVPG